MNLQDVRDLIAYNDWANRLLLDRTEEVTSEQFTAPSSASFGSLKATLVHTLDTEWGWRLMLEGQGFTQAMEPDEFPTFAALRARWEEEVAAWQAYIDSLSDDDLLRVVRYEGDAGVQRERIVWHVIFHVVNHGMQHRSEAAALLTQYGHSPGDIDFTIFLNERAARQRGEG